MAVINCPACSKKISDKAPTCSHCGLEIANATGDRLSHIRKVNRIQRAQTLLNQSFIAMLLFCAGFLGIFWYDNNQTSWQYLLSMIVCVIGFFSYIITRIRLIIFKRTSKEL
ncbi:hypothetical protein LP316_11970 [Thalassotalea sp. LPB0316]|uniref:hypothetical protein n=1 Tax=Thalassotalea sp. LPB0316 TaxID=2769490 RepID=UPI001869502F|nr:hypothetical protein [Thalassotalea sp. LPB0316]QOL25018.1 hypothetical protein LP316_11970 [Thalassotalea sp. LPB0316]